MTIVIFNLFILNNVGQDNILREIDPVSNITVDYIGDDGVIFG